jgi:hypothetical protein
MRNFWHKWGRGLIIGVLLYAAHLTVEGLLVNYALGKAGLVKWV